MCDVFEPLWSDGVCVDAGDMPREMRDVLARLVRGDIIYDTDGGAYDLIKSDDSLVCRDLSNLGLQLIVNDTWRFMYACEVAEDLRGEIAAIKRNVRVENDVMFMAIKLRRHFEQCLSREEPPRVTEAELYDMWQSSSFAKDCADDATLATRKFSGLLDRLRRRGLGIIRKVSGEDAYDVLPTIMVFVSDDVLRGIALDG